MYVILLLVCMAFFPSTSNPVELCSHLIMEVSFEFDQKYICNVVLKNDTKNDGYEQVSISDSCRFFKIDIRPHRGGYALEFFTPWSNTVISNNVNVLYANTFSLGNSITYDDTYIHNNKTILINSLECVYSPPPSQPPSSPSSLSLSPPITPKLTVVQNNFLTETTVIVISIAGVFVFFFLIFIARACTPEKLAETGNLLNTISDLATTIQDVICCRTRRSERSTPREPSEVSRESNETIISKDFVF